MTADNNSFVLYTNYFEILKDLTTEDAGHIFKAILEYKATGNFQIPNHLLIAFKFIKNQLDIDNTKYQEKCEKAKANGLKGGRPRTPKNQTVLKKPNGYFEKHNENENDNDNDNDNVFPPIFPKNGNEEKEEKKEDIFINPVIENFSREYQKVFKTRPPLMQNHREKILELNRELEDFKETIPEVLGALKTLNFPDVGFKPNIMWLLKDDNYIKVKLGEFTSKKEKSILDFMYDEKDLVENG